MACSPASCAVLRHAIAVLRAVNCDIANQNSAGRRYVPGKAYIPTHEPNITEIYPEATAAMQFAKCRRMAGLGCGVGGSVALGPTDGPQSRV